MLSPRSSIAFLLASSAGLTPVSAQGVSSRHLYAATAAYEVHGLAGELNALPSPQRLRWFDHNSEGIEVPSAFEAAGQVQWLSSTGTRTFLVSGASDLSGPANPVSTLQVVRLTASPAKSIDVVDSATYTNNDFVAACWHEGLGVIYAVDNIEHKMKMAPWKGPGNALPRAFDDAFASSQCATLNAGQLLLVPLPQGIRLVLPRMNYGEDALWTGFAWVFQPYQLGVDEPPRWHVDNEKHVTAQEPFTLQLLGSASPADFEVWPLLDPMAVPLVSGVHPGTGVVSIPPPAVFFALPGRPYEVRGEPNRGEIFTPLANYGAPVSSSEFLVGRDLAVPSGLHFVGVRHLCGMTARFKIASPSPTQTIVPIYLFVGIRTEATDPVITFANGGASIAGAGIFTSSVTVPAGGEEFFARFRWDIPDEDAVENVVLLYQIVAADPLGGTAFTTVRATSILPTSASPLGRPRPRHGGHEGKPVQNLEGYDRYWQGLAAQGRSQTSVLAARAWLKFDPHGEVPKHTAELRTILQQKMRRQ